jgi:hypothetical protein
MVVLVSITNCQVSLNPKKGPVTAQPTMIGTAKRNARGCSHGPSGARSKSSKD